MPWLPDWLTGYDPANADAAAAAQAQLVPRNDALLASGIWSDDQYWASMGRLGASQDVDRAEINQAFTASVQTNLDTAKGWINSAVWQTLKAIPISVWLIAGLALFVWMGGLTLLRGRLKR